MAEAETPENESAGQTEDSHQSPVEAASDVGVAVGDNAAIQKPGFTTDLIRRLIRWHSIIFLGLALGLAVFAWVVYPEKEPEEAPPADLFYHDGLDRLYRVLNPVLPLRAGTPGEEALAARNAFLNLFVFHRAELGKYPEFINPHLLLAEANRLLAEFHPGIAEKFYADASIAYADAVL
ncbi:MAG: hypothetical protein FWG74_09505, partial [Planctomycetes bacterium]|nr:hypothetical protein [Planctomycetota bacterium]